MVDRFAFVYESCDIPEGLTIREWRNSLSPNTPPRGAARRWLHGRATTTVQPAMSGGPTNFDTGTPGATSFEHGVFFNDRRIRPVRGWRRVVAFSLSTGWKATK